MIKLIYIVSLFVFFSVNCSAAPIVAYQFDSPEQEVLFNKLSNEIRCLVCQNQSIAESNAGLAQDLRNEIHKMILQGKTENEIADFLVQRYGDFVLYNPPIKPLTWLLWFGPVIVFIYAIYYVFRFVSQQKNISPVEEGMTEEEKERLNRLQSENKE